MKRIIASLVIGMSALSGQAFAWVGGPFDNGFHSAALEQNSIYQATLSFKNGSGFCYFQPNASVVPENTGTTTYATRGASNNRSVLYYKGITYFGNCFGFVDGEARFIQANFNASSEASTETSSISGGTSATQTTLNPSVYSNITASGKSFTANGAFVGKISQTAPSLRFHGQGEISFLTPNGADSINTLAYQGYSGLIGAIISFVGNSRVTDADAIDYSTIFGGAQQAINDALVDLRDNFLSTGGIDQTFGEAEVIKLNVSGTRRYL